VALEKPEALTEKSKEPIHHIPERWNDPQRRRKRIKIQCRGYMTYTCVLLIFGLLPLGLLWLAAPWAIRRYKASLVTIVILISMISVPWELIAVGHVWYYSPTVILGVKLLGLPIEELAFFMIDGLLVGTLALWLDERYHARY
jgi:lycopene cyclase domain-containing protein